MSVMVQATMWQAQLTDGSKLRGGQTNFFSTDVNVSAVPLDQLKVFTIGHNTFADTFYAPTGVWYKNGKPWTTRPAIVEYTMQDGSILTVDYTGGVLDLFQTVI